MGVAGPFNVEEAVGHVYFVTKPNPCVFVPKPKTSHPVCKATNSSFAMAATILVPGAEEVQFQKRPVIMVALFQPLQMLLWVLCGCRDKWQQCSLRFEDFDSDCYHCYDCAVNIKLEPTTT